MSVQHPAPAAAKAPTGRTDKIAFVSVIFSQLLYLLVAARHLYLLKDLSDHAGAFDNQTTAGLADLLDRADRVDDSMLTLRIASIAVVVIFLLWLYRVNYHFTQAGQPNGYRKLLAYRVWMAAVLAWLVVIFVLSPAAINEPTSQAVRDYAQDATINTVIRMAIGLVYIWCAYSIRNAARHLPAE